MRRRLALCSRRHAAVAVAAGCLHKRAAFPLLLTHSTWRQHLCFSTSSAPSSTSSSMSHGSNGLFGVRGLLSPADFKRFADKVMVRCNELRELIRARNSVSDTTKVEYILETLSLLDSVSNEICSVIDAAELCRHVHTDKMFVDASVAAFNVLSSYIHSLNSDTTLYLKLREITNNETIMNQLPEESRIFARDLRNEFESDGIHLDPTGKLRACELQAGIIRSESVFVQNVSRADDIESQVFPLGPFRDDPSSQYAQISSWIGSYVAQPPAGAIPARHLLCSGSKKIANPLLRSLDEEPLRKQLWLNSTETPVENAVVLGNLIKDRQKFAKLLGFKSSSHKYLANKVMRTPEEVQAFLQSTSDALRDKASGEIAVLSDLKRQIVGRGDGGKEAHLQPWDIAYLSNRHRAALAQQGSQSTSALSDISSYLGVDGVLEGLRFVSQEVFGVEVTEEAMTADENWVMMTQGGSSKYGRAIKFRVRDSRNRHSNGSSLGTVYVDLYNRKGKFPGSAHFTVKCGCKTGGGGDLQEPTIALVFNFTPQGNFTPALSLHELEILYHEWGHALHSLLSRTTYQHLSGTRGAADFVEVPSHLFEYFARAPDVVSLWARNSVTDMRVPQGLLQEALLAKSSFGALELQTQLLYSAADQFCFGTAIGDLDGCDAQEVYHRARSGVGTLQSLLTDIPLPLDYDKHHKAGMCLLSHSHFVNYGGGYYSYLFARMYACQIWHHRFAAQPLSPASGAFIRDRMLRFGAGRDMGAMLAEAGGGPLNPRYFLEKI